MAFVNLTPGAPNGQNPPNTPPNTPPNQPPTTPPNGGGGINSIGAGGPQLTNGDVDPAELVAELCINYNEKFKGQPLALFRDGVIAQMMGVLTSKKKPNPLLVGDAGTGKTAVVESLATMIADNDPRVPDTLSSSTIYELPLSNVVSGSSLVGELEEKMKAIIDFMCDKKNDAILFVDEVHQLAGHSEIYAKIAQILKPAMARGDLRLIGATTTQEVQNLSSDPAFNRRFGRVIVDELSTEQTITILNASMGSYIAHHKGRVALNPDLMETVAAIADRYHSAGAHRPDTALTLLDRTLADAVVERKRQEAQADAETDPALKKAMLSQLAAQPKAIIDEVALKRTAMRLMTGNTSAKTLMQGELEDALSHIFGQKAALRKVIDAVERDSRNVFPRERPLTMLFCGPSGTGKSEVARVLAGVLGGKGGTPITLNMTEYDSDASINRIIGSPAGYVGYDSAGELPLDKLDSNPFQVILLDEFEKASKAVQRLFMGAFEDGYIKTSKGKVIDFSRSIVIATTNAGQTNHKKAAMGFGGTEETSETEASVEMLKPWFDIELLNRFNVILTFEEIEKETYKTIVSDVWKTQAAIAKAGGLFPKIPDEVPADVLEKIVKDTYNKAFGARPARRAVRDEIERIALS